MKQFIIVSILLLLLISEGIAIDFLPESLLASNQLIVPHWVFIYLFMILMLFDNDETYYAISYAVIYGLLIDLVYTDLLGIYAFVYPFIIYILSVIKTYVNSNLVILTILMIIGLVFVELLLYFLYGAMGIRDMSMSIFVKNRLVPTTIANLLFMWLMYFLSRKWLPRKDKAFL